jgi:hypothetical protein
MPQSTIQLLERGLFLSLMMGHGFLFLGTLDFDTYLTLNQEVISLSTI